MTHDWRDARGSLGIPVAIFAGVGLVASLPMHSLWLGCLSAVVIAASIAVQSGFSVDLAQLRVRSWWGWGSLRFGRWLDAPPQRFWAMVVTKQSLMNRRGAPQSVGIESWEFGWWDGKGEEWFGVYEFTDRAKARDAAEKLSIHDIRRSTDRGH